MQATQKHRYLEHSRANPTAICHEDSQPVHHGESTSKPGDSINTSICREGISDWNGAN